jgi:hypothetical protein
MCRNIRPLYNYEPPATPQEVQGAALQYVRKVSGTSKPSAANLTAFERAVAEVGAATQRLLDSMVTETSRPRKPWNAMPFVSAALPASTEITSLKLHAGDSLTDSVSA